MKFFSKTTLGKLALLVTAILITVFTLADSGLAQSGVQKFERLVTRTLLVQKTATFQDAVTLSNGLTLDTGNLDMDTNLITNIGNSGTDFASNGGLTLANNLTVATGGITITAGGLDMNSTVITNIGNAGTDFNSSGGLTTAAGITVTTGGVTVTAGGLTLSDGDATVADFVTLTAQTAISVTDGGIITPTGSYQPLESAGAVTATMSSSCTAGQVVTFINTVNQTIIISETETSALSGNASLGQYDAVSVLCDGTQWVQVAPESDN